MRPSPFTFSTGKQAFWPNPGFGTAEDALAGLARRHLTDTYHGAEWIPYDHKAPLVFFSDCHRDTREKTDCFQANEKLFYHALNHYYKTGYTYVEVGDGDEMYKHAFLKICNSYVRIFELLYRFHRQ